MRLRKGEFPDPTGILTECKICGVEKDDCYFKYSKGKRAGLTCRECSNAVKALEYANDEKLRERYIKKAKKQIPNKQAAKKYREENIEKIKANKKAYHLENKEKINAKTRLWYSENKERHAATGKIYREENLEKITEQAHRHYIENKESYAAKDKKYRESNKEEVREYFVNYHKERIKRIPSWSEAAEIENFYKNKPKNMEVDHIIPFFGKLVSGLHVISNLQYLTRSENASKHNKFNPLEFNND